MSIAIVSVFPGVTSDVRGEGPARRVSPQVQMIVGKASQVSVEVRIRETGNLNFVSEADQRALIHYLLETGGPDSDLIGFVDQEMQVKNEVMNWLVASPVGAPRLMEVLLGILVDESRSVTMRDYAAQHASKLLLRSDLEGSARQELVSTLYQVALQERANSISGSICLALGQFVMNTGQAFEEAGVLFSLSRDKFLRVCGTIAGDTDAFIGSRAAAVAIAGEVLEPEEPSPSWIREVFDQASMLGGESLGGGQSADRRQNEKSAPSLGAQTALILACARALLQSGSKEDKEAVKLLADQLQSDELQLVSGGILRENLTRLVQQSAPELKDSLPENEPFEP
ncbi:MAG: hypothetical protein AAGA96_12290 [Verrucomicrobiota bacterium]